MNHNILALLDEFKTKHWSEIKETELDFMKHQWIKVIDRTDDLVQFIDLTTLRIKTTSMMQALILNLIVGRIYTINESWSYAISINDVDMYEKSHEFRQFMKVLKTKYKGKAK